MVVGDVISIREQVMKYMYIPTEIKRELVRFGVETSRLPQCVNRLENKTKTGGFSQHSDFHQQCNRTANEATVVAENYRSAFVFKPIDVP